METTIVGVAAVCLFFFKVSRFSSWRPRQRRDTGDGFGNHAEQRSPEQEPGATPSALPTAEPVSSINSSSFGAGS